jgi:hypothetical protein
MTQAQSNHLTDLIEAAHFAPDDDAYLAIVIDNLLALREAQQKQTDLLTALVEGQSQILQLAATLVDQQTKPASKSRRVQHQGSGAARVAECLSAPRKPRR